MKLDFRSNKNQASIGNNSSISVKVFDDRKNKETLGQKKFGEEKIKIIAEQNLADFLQEKFAAGLALKGFKIGFGPLAEFHVEILEYEAARHFPVGNSEAHAAIKVIVKSDKNSGSFTKNYKLDLRNKHFLAPLESTDEQTINSLLQEISSDIISDNALLTRLAQ